MPRLWTGGRPLFWSDEELERDRQVAIRGFVDRRLGEGVEEYAAAFRAHQALVARLFSSTSDLRAFSGAAFVEKPDLIDPARYIAGPPMSRDDLKTLLGANPFVKKLDAELARRTAELLLRLIDPFRFPWLPRGRAPRAEERRMAIRWTTSLFCVERIRTSRRMESSDAQQKAVAACLAQECSLKERSVQRIDALEDLPAGAFTNETLLAGVKCDVPVRLRDRRLLAIECKVSNSSANSVKRLNREVGSKAEIWNRAYGAQVFAAAVLDGVFALTNLQAAQRAGVAIFWAHDLSLLRRVVSGRRRG